MWQTLANPLISNCGCSTPKKPCACKKHKKAQVVVGNALVFNDNSQTSLAKRTKGCEVDEPDILDENKRRLGLKKRITHGDSPVGNWETINGGGGSGNFGHAGRPGQKGGSGGSPIAREMSAKARAASKVAKKAQSELGVHVDTAKAHDAARSLHSVAAALHGSEGNKAIADKHLAKMNEHAKAANAHRPMFGKTSAVEAAVRYQVDPTTGDANKVSVNSDSFTTLVSNLAAGRVRKAKMGGREYLVAPLTLIIPGVLNGSKGPLFYPMDEITANYEAWNHMPIVVYHPSKDGYPVSARSPDILEKQCIGVVLNARIRGKLVAEGWFDIDACKRIDDRVLDSLKNNRPIELSTGLFTDNFPATENAAYNGRRYTHIARNYRPDHLAILPDQVGACSLNDGCGVLINMNNDGWTTINGGKGSGNFDHEGRPGHIGGSGGGGSGGGRKQDGLVGLPLQAAKSSLEDAGYKRVPATGSLHKHTFKHAETGHEVTVTLDKNGNVKDVTKAASESSGGKSLGPVADKQEALGKVMDHHGIGHQADVMQSRVGDHIEYKSLNGGSLGHFDTKKNDVVVKGESAFHKFAKSGEAEEKAGHSTETKAKVSAIGKTAYDATTKANKSGDPADHKKAAKAHRKAAANATIAKVAEIHERQAAAHEKMIGKKPTGNADGWQTVNVKTCEKLNNSEGWVSLPSNQVLQFA